MRALVITVTEPEYTANIFRVCSSFLIDPGKGSGKSSVCPKISAKDVHVIR
jgi:hypothetical protein